MKNPRRVRGPHAATASVGAPVADEFAATQVLGENAVAPPVVEGDANSQSVYSEYVQELERMLKEGTGK